MRRFLPHLWAATGLFAALLTCGCQSTRCCRCSKSNAPAAATMNPPLTLATRPSAAGRSIESTTRIPPLPAAARPAPVAKTPAQATTVSLPVAEPQAPVVHTAAKVDPAPTPEQDSLLSLIGPNTAGQTAAGAPAGAPGAERFGHDPNYRWLVGTLDYSKIQEAWLLRYVSYEQDDRYGGCVTLVGPPAANLLKAGKTVRVEGSLIDPDSRHLRPAYQVENMTDAGL